DISDKGTVNLEPGRYFVKLVPKANIPQNYTLKQNMPNPFNQVTTIEYGLPASGEVTLVIYDLLGKKVRTLVNGHAEAGMHKVEWNGKDDNGSELPSGIYFYKMTTNNYSEIKKMTLLK
ncbi:MAG: FlgD immunoglobulin-like domain containing protein, partial [bacterium]